MLFYRPLFLISDMLVYVCESQKKYWRSRALRAKQDTVIHNGIDVEYFTDRYTAEVKNTFRNNYGFSRDDYVVGLCANMRPEKAHGDLLQAIANLRVAQLDVKCLFIGDGPERTNIEAEIEAMGLAPHVGITGLITDVRAAIASCDVMALVSHHIETFSIAALEAMALEKPMVMTKIGGAAEQIIHGENGYLYKRGDITALADALHQLMESKRRGQMGHHARATVAEKFLSCRHGRCLRPAFCPTGRIACLGRLWRACRTTAVCAKVPSCSLWREASSMDFRWRYRLSWCATSMLLLLASIAFCGCSPGLYWQSHLPSCLNPCSTFYRAQRMEKSPGLSEISWSIYLRRDALSVSRPVDGIR